MEKEKLSLEEDFTEMLENLKEKDFTEPEADSMIQLCKKKLTDKPNADSLLREIINGTHEEFEAYIKPKIDNFLKESNT